MAIATKERHKVTYRAYCRAYKVLTRIPARMRQIRMFASAPTKESWYRVFGPSLSSKAWMASADDDSQNTAQIKPNPSKVSTMDVVARGRTVSKTGACRTQASLSSQGHEQHGHHRRWAPSRSRATESSCDSSKVSGILRCVRSSTDISAPSLLLSVHSTRRHLHP